MMTIGDGQGHSRAYGVDPPRWRDDPEAARGGGHLFVRTVRRPQAARPPDLARLEVAVHRICHGPVRRARAGSRFLGAAAAAAATLGLLGAAFAVWRHGRVDARPPTLAVPSVAAAPPECGPTTAAAAAPARAPSPVTHHRRVACAASTGQVNDDALARETALVDFARDRLTVAPGDSLAALDRHRRSFPHGQLAAEREFLAVEALLRLHRSGDARRRAAVLGSLYPESSYAARAARLVDGGDAHPPSTL